MSENYTVAEIEALTKRMFNIGRRILSPSVVSQDEKADLSVDDRDVLEALISQLEAEAMELQHERGAKLVQEVDKARENRIFKTESACRALCTVLSMDVTSSDRKQAMVTALDSLCDADEEEDRELEMLRSQTEKDPRATESPAKSFLEKTLSHVTDQDGRTLRERLAIEGSGEVSGGFKGSVQSQETLQALGFIRGPNLASVRDTLELSHRADAWDAEWKGKYREWKREVASKEGGNNGTDVNVECPTQ